MPVSATKVSSIICFRIWAWSLPAPIQTFSGSFSFASSAETPMSPIKSYLRVKDAMRDLTSWTRVCHAVGVALGSFCSTEAIKI